MLDNEALERSVSRLVAPDYLEEGQNFYNQPPFDFTFTDIGSNYGLSTENMRAAMTCFVRRLNGGSARLLESTNQPVNPEDFSLRVKELLSSKGELTIIMSKTDVKTENREGLKTAIQGVNERLKSFPLWYSYVATQLLENGAYRENGEYNVPNRQKSFVPTSGYASWINRITQSNKSSVLHGISEVLPKDASTPVTVPAGHKPGWRSLAIRRAAGLLPEK